MSSSTVSKVGVVFPIRPFRALSNITVTCKIILHICKNLVQALVLKEKYSQDVGIACIPGTGVVEARVEGLGLEGQHLGTH